MKKAKRLGSLAMVAGLALTMAACGNNNNSSSNGGSGSQSSASGTMNFKQAVPKKPVKKGGSITVAIETDTPFTGIFSNELETSAIDAGVMGPGNDSLFDVDNEFNYIKGGAADVSINKDAKTVTIKINPKVKWSDGQPLVAKDYEYAYEIIGNKATQSQRYTSSLADLVGFADYHNGKSNTISGLEMPDGPQGRTVVLHFKEMKPGMTKSGNGYFWESAVPYHYLKDVPFDKLITSDKIRKKPLFFGPFILQKIVRGQSVTWVKNKNYWRGEPKLDRITASVISPNSVAQSIKSHKFDIIDVINSQWPSIKGASGYNFVGKKGLGYDYLAFKVGKYDKTSQMNVMNPSAKMQNQALRQAIGYGMNVGDISRKYEYGLSFRINTLIPDAFGKYYAKNAPHFSYNLKKGNELLDKAGFKKKGMYRTLPNGKPLVINFAAMSGSKIQEPIIQNYIQQWKKEGLHVKLVGGRLMEFNSFYQKVENDDPSIDMFIGGWSLSTEPSPMDLYSKTAPFNFSRFVTPENTALLNAIDSQKAFDSKYRIKKFKEWQAYMNKEAYVIPLSNSYSITAVNSKLSGYSLYPKDGNGGLAKLGFIK